MKLIFKASPTKFYSSGEELGVCTEVVSFLLTGQIMALASCFVSHLFQLTACMGLSWHTWKTGNMSSKFSGEREREDCFYIADNNLAWAIKWGRNWKRRLPHHNYLSLYLALCFAPPGFMSLIYCWETLWPFTRNSTTKKTVWTRQNQCLFNYAAVIYTLACRYMSTRNMAMLQLYVHKLDRDKNDWQI